MVSLPELVGGRSAVNSQAGSRAGLMQPTLLAIVALAAIVRFARWPTPAALVLGDEASYDPAVMYVASASFLHGLMPYRDFTFLHPPGVLLGMAPSVLVGGFLGDAVGLASARVGVILLGVANAVLVASLLKRYGFQPMLLGGGLYAGWGTVVFTEQFPMLEPFLVTALLVSFHLFRSPRRWAPLVMGLILGVATMVKVWAAVDLVVFAVVFLILRRFADLGRFTVGATIGGCAIALPFLASAPALMWEMIVTAQLGRPNAGVGLLARAGTFNPVPTLSHPVYLVFMALLLVLMLAVCVLLVLRGWTRRTDSAEAVESAVWAAFAFSHTLVIMFSSSYYGHYAMFAAAPLILVAGAAFGWARERVDLDRRGVTSAVTAIVLLVAAASGITSLHRAIRADQISWEESSRMAAWADERGCTWSSVQDRVLIDNVVASLREGCEITVDAFGENLLAYSRGRADWAEAGRTLEMSHIAQAERLVLPEDESRWSFTEQQSAQIKSDFVVSEKVGNRILWIRRSGDDQPA